MTLLKKTEEPLAIRPVSSQDCRMIWEWANEAGVRASAFHSDPILWEDHVRWFEQKLKDPRCFIYLLVREERPIGQVRFDLLDDGSAEIDISISGQERGQGRGTEGLRLACQYFFQEHPGKRVNATIKSANLPSIRAFQKAGFVERGRKVVQGQPVVWMSLESSRG